MNKEFVPYQESVELKELGFDEPCLAYWFNETPTNPQGQCIVYYKKPWDNEKIVKGVIREYCSAPTFSQAFRWFREKYGLMHIINPYEFTAEIDYLQERIVDEKYGDFIPHDHLVDDEGEEIKHSSYEEAEQACLKKLIEIVKNK